MEFRLTYEGPLYGTGNSGNKRPEHKQDLRRKFHKQLKRFWEHHPYLKDAHHSHKISGRVMPEVKLSDYLAKKYALHGYNFVPLVTAELRVRCELNILFIRPMQPGEILNSGDIDNRIKTLFDALTIIQHREQLAGHEAPQDDERPFYCLLSDDKLISKVSVETDTLLQPIGDKWNPNDARLIIQVKVHPYEWGWDNIGFG
ncbi:MAG: hypothetical protein ACK4FJ_11115 [Ferrovibrio sp.]|uniref:hypothetical protein n=1 Tax=Ferrovibrio sp. TaxID=1917215 RepID=UPI003919BBA0